MSIISYLIIAAIVSVLIYFITLFNHLISVKNNVKKSWSNIDVLLKQRHEELPKLVDTCKQYMTYERSVLQKITELRASVDKARLENDMAALGKAETALRGALGNLFAVAENYPDLKANVAFMHLQDRITGLETDIADRRELYNESATLNNIRIEQFPDVIIAKLFGFPHVEVLEFTEDIGFVSVNELFK